MVTPVTVSAVSVPPFWTRSPVVIEIFAASIDPDSWVVLPALLTHIVPFAVVVPVKVMSLLPASRVIPADVVSTPETAKSVEVLRFSDPALPSTPSIALFALLRAASPVASSSSFLVVIPAVCDTVVALTLSEVVASTSASVTPFLLLIVTLSAVIFVLGFWNQLTPVREISLPAALISPSIFILLAALAVRLSVNVPIRLTSPAADSPRSNTTETFPPTTESTTNLSPDMMVTGPLAVPSSVTPLPARVMSPAVIDAAASTVISPVPVTNLPVRSKADGFSAATNALTFSVLMPIAAAAKMPPTFTTEPAPKAKPFGLSTKTLPWPLMVPSITDLPAEALTRFHQVASAPL